MKFTFLALVFALLATNASALSNMQRTVIGDMQRANLPEDCIAKLTNSDAARITSIKNSPDRSEGTKNRQIRNEYRKICER